MGDGVASSMVGGRAVEFQHGPAFVVQKLWLAHPAAPLARLIRWHADGSPFGSAGDGQGTSDGGRAGMHENRVLMR